MSQANVEIVRQVFDAVARHDGAAALALYDPDFEWDFSRVRWGDLAGPSVHHGRDGLQRVYREWYRGWENYDEKIEELIDGGENVVSVVSARGRGRVSGVEVEITVVGVWTIRGDRIVRSVWFPTRDEALEAAGLSD